MREGGLPCKKGRRKKQRTRKRVGKERGLDFLSGAARKMSYGEDFWGRKKGIKDGDFEWNTHRA